MVFFFSANTLGFKDLKENTGMEYLRIMLLLKKVMGAE